jgi:hypothetical protein
VDKLPFPNTLTCSAGNTKTTPHVHGRAWRTPGACMDLLDCERRRPKAQLLLNKARQCGWRWDTHRGWSKWCNHCIDPIRQLQTTWGLISKACVAN